MTAWPRSTEGLLGQALLYQEKREEAAALERTAKVAFIYMALSDGWSWSKIGQALGVSDTGARRYFDRNWRGESDVIPDARRRTGRHRRAGVAMGTQGVPASDHS